MSVWERVAPVKNPVKICWSRMLLPLWPRTHCPFSTACTPLLVTALARRRLPQDALTADMRRLLCERAAALARYDRFSEQATAAVAQLQRALARVTAQREAALAVFEEGQQQLKRRFTVWLAAGAHKVRAGAAQRLAEASGHSSSGGDE